VVASAEVLRTSFTLLYDTGFSGQVLTLNRVAQPY